MATKKSSTTRKGLAFGLAFVGIAGLSLASAAQLNLTGPTAGTLQAGSTAVVNGDCQTTAIPVTFAAPVRVGAAYKSAQIDLSGIQAACSGKSYKVSVLTAANQPVVPEKAGTVAAVVAPATTSSLFVDISGLDTAQVDSIKQVSLTIYS
ncbi:hypothetical protein [Cellulomonas fimi]|uniref:Uncharacterized protein n=1 Tax=Cellulomonas fimi TaxID=1708 RepID=A0A7Y0QII1_CELFI|nr:hypothetical protein [Cellulomonas fimi]NMR20312.1 hypothetical protein [Cellulomonas fimi]